MTKTFVKFLLDRKIKIKGTPENLLFRLVDVARKIEDENYARATKDYDETLITTEDRKPVKYLTTLGLYEYLLTSAKPNAIIFRKLMTKLFINGCNSKYKTLTLFIKWIIELPEPKPQSEPESKTEEIQVSIDESKDVPFSYTVDEVAEAQNLTQDDIDNKIIDFKDHHCIYFLRLYAAGALGVNKPVYKFGRTKDIKTRLNTYLDHPFNVERIFKVPPEHMTNIENLVKCLAFDSNEYHTYINLHELIATVDIQKYYDLIELMF